MMTACDSDLRHELVHGFGRSESVATFLIELSMCKEKLVYKYVEPMMREMATNVIMLHKEYLGDSRSGGKQILSFTKDGIEEIDLNYSDVQLNYLCEHVQNEFIEPQFREVFEGLVAHCEEQVRQPCDKLRQKYAMGD